MASISFMILSIFFLIPSAAHIYSFYLLPPGIFQFLFLIAPFFPSLLPFLQQTRRIFLFLPAILHKLQAPLHSSSFCPVVLLKYLLSFGRHYNQQSAFFPAIV